MPTSATGTDRAETREAPRLAPDSYVGHWLAVVFGCLAFLTAGCSFGGREEPRFVDAAETAELARTATGCLLINQSWDAAEPDRPRILAVRFPTCDRPSFIASTNLSTSGRSPAPIARVESHSSSPISSENGSVMR